MRKGLSLLQRNILDALAVIPARVRDGIDCQYIGDWATPKNIMDALGRKPTNSNRAAISRALARLCERRLVAKAQGQISGTGKSGRYALTTGVRPVTREVHQREPHSGGSSLAK